MREILVSFAPVKPAFLRILVISDYRATVTMRPEATIYMGLARLGHHIEVMTHPEAALCADLAAAGVVIHPWHPQKQFDRQAVARIRERLIDGEFHILQLYNSKAYFNGLQAARNLPVKVVLYIGYEGHIAWYQPALCRPAKATSPCPRCCKIKRFVCG
ncbi:MAG: glycosyltransferase [Bacteroidia bacterium]